MHEEDPDDAGQMVVDSIKTFVENCRILGENLGRGIQLLFSVPSVSLPNHSPYSSIHTQSLLTLTRRLGAGTAGMAGSRTSREHRHTTTIGSL